MTTYNQKTEEQLEIIFNNKHTAIVNVSSFAESIALKNAIQLALSKQKMSLDLQSVDLHNIDTASLIQLLCVIDSDKNYNDCLQNCLQNCIYNNVPVNIDTFKPVNTRQNYYVLVASVIKMNIVPFFQNLTQLFTELVGNKELKNQE